MTDCGARNDHGQEGEGQKGREWGRQDRRVSIVRVPPVAGQEGDPLVGPPGGDDAQGDVHPGERIATDVLNACLEGWRHPRKEQ